MTQKQSRRDKSVTGAKQQRGHKAVHYAMEGLSKHNYWSLHVTAFMFRSLPQPSVPHALWSLVCIGKKDQVPQAIASHQACWQMMMLPASWLLHITSVINISKGRASKLWSTMAQRQPLHEICCPAKSGTCDMLGFKVPRCVCAELCGPSCFEAVLFIHACL